MSFTYKHKSNVFSILLLCSQSVFAIKHYFHSWRWSVSKTADEIKESTVKTIMGLSFT